TLGASVGTGNAVAMTVYTGARHSFDQIDIGKAIASPYTQADKDAQIARLQQQAQEAPAQFRSEEAERMRQLRLDQALLETYRSVQDLDSRRDRELRELDRSIRELRARESELIERQRVMIDEATHTDKSDVAASLEADIRLLDSEIAAQSSVVAAKLRERNAVVERFEEHRRRYVELTSAPESARIPPMPRR
ncbi:MAG TPA: hypothetical protein PLH95_10085, partial [Thauera aminoaromatica]|nr:hypothetical protein [Thauera aminoaromatica]